MTTAPTPDLLPCPFCGGPVAMEEAYPTRSSMYGERRWWGVTCRNTINRGGSCAIQQIPSASIDAAAERWNHRAPMEARKPLPVSVERLGELWASQRCFHGGEPLKCGHVEFARLVEVEYGVLGRIPIREENGGQIDHNRITERTS